MSSPALTELNPEKIEHMRRQVLSPLGMRAWMLAKLPLALMAGLRVTELDADRCAVTVPYGWRSQNPFRSTYFAALSMAAEMSTGALALILIQATPQPCSMLITGMTAEFVKKATTTTTFTCDAGPTLREAVSRTLETGEPETRTVESVGRLPNGEVAARFTFTWSFKRKGSGAQG